MRREAKAHFKRLRDYAWDGDHWAFPDEALDAIEADLEALGTVGDALVAAVEAHSFAFSDDTALAILSRLAEYRKIRPQEEKDETVL